MINAIIIDDELNCITALQNDLKMFCTNVNVIDACNSSKQGFLAIKKYQPDLVFLDIEMPVFNGFELLELFNGEVDFQVIFTTAYENFATKAFRVNALDYLLKPIAGEDLIAAVKKCEALITLHTNPGRQIDNLISNNQLSAEQQKIAFPNRTGFDFIEAAEIIYCAADGNYTRLILKNSGSLLVSKSLGEVEALLPMQLFERIHHSYLINVSQIKKLKKAGNYLVEMSNGDGLKISRSRKSQLLDRIGFKVS